MPKKCTTPVSRHLPLADIICIIVWITILALGLVSVPFLIQLESTLDINPTFTLHHASVTGFNLTSDGHLTSFFHIVINVNNSHDETTLRFSSIRVSIFKDNQDLAQDVLGDFSLHQMNVTLLKAEPVSLNVSLANEPMFDLGLESGMGYINFYVVITAMVNLQVLNVMCRHVVVNITTTSSLYSSSPSSLSNIVQSINCSSFAYRVNK